MYTSAMAELAECPSQRFIDETEHVSRDPNSIGRHLRLRSLAVEPRRNPLVVGLLCFASLQVSETLATRHSAHGMPVGDVPTDATELRESELRDSPVGVLGHAKIRRYNTGSSAASPPSPPEEL
jgi:hypothetical protein